MASSMAWVNMALMEMSTVVTSMRGQCGAQDDVRGFGVEPEIEFVAGAGGEFGVVGLGVEAAAHEDDALRERGEIGIDARWRGRCW